MKHLLILSAAALALTACAQAPASSESSPSPLQSPTTAPVEDDVTGLEPLTVVPSAINEDTTFSPRPVDEHAEVVRAVFTGGDLLPTQEDLRGRQTLAPAFAVWAQCKGVERMTVQLRDAATAGDETVPFAEIEVPCGAVHHAEFAHVDAPPRSVEIDISSDDITSLDAWVVVENGVG